MNACKVVSYPSFTHLFNNCLLNWGFQNCYQTTHFLFWVSCHVTLGIYLTSVCQGLHM